MREDSFHLLESLFIPQCRHRIMPIFDCLTKLDKDPDNISILDECLNLFEAQKQDVEKILGRKIDLDIREYLGVFARDRRSLINRLRVFKIRSMPGIIIEDPEDSV